MILSLAFCPRRQWLPYSIVAKNGLQMLQYIRVYSNLSADTALGA